MTDRGHYDYGPQDRGQYARERDPYAREQEPYDSYAETDPYSRDQVTPTTYSGGGRYGPHDDPYARHRPPSRRADGERAAGRAAPGSVYGSPRGAGDRRAYEEPQDLDDLRGYDDRTTRYDQRTTRYDERGTGYNGRATHGNRRAEPLLDRRPEGERESLRARARQVRKNMPLWQELPLLLIVAFCLAVLVRTFLVQAFYIPSGSMEDTLLVGDRVLVNKIVYDVRQPERGEIVVFRGTDNWAPENVPQAGGGFFAKLGRTVGDLVGVSQPGEKDFIKRVIALPGDEVSCCNVDGKVMVNGTPLDEPYVHENSPADAPPVPRECRSRQFGPVTVEPGQMWVMGDHRLVSQDSRCQGQVPIDNVIGRAFVIVWPSERWAGLGLPSTFAHVERPHVAAGLPGSEPSFTRTAPVGAFVAPIIASLVVPARSRRIRRRRPRTLRP